MRPFLARVSAGLLRSSLWFLLGWLTSCAAPQTSIQPAPSGHRPGWLPRYSQAQLALIAPTNELVEVPARPVYPSLERFAYVQNRVLRDPREAVRLTQMVAEGLERASHTYALADISPALANYIAQYGPPGATEPDNFSIAAIKPGGEPTLVRDPQASEARAALVRLRSEAAAPPTERQLRELQERFPNVPAVKLALAEFFAAHGSDLAEATFRDALHSDATLSTAHLGLAKLFAQRKDAARSRLALANALAYHPSSVAAKALVPFYSVQQKPRAIPYGVFFEVDERGAIRVGATPTDGARMYAGCRALLRYEPEFREMLFDVPRAMPYFLSALEEVVCIESAIGAYLVSRMAARDAGLEPPTDEQTAAMLRIAHKAGLAGFVMVEIVGQHRPERARLAPPEVHREMVAYLLEYVLGDSGEPGPPLVAAPRNQNASGEELAVLH